MGQYVAQNNRRVVSIEDDADMIELYRLILKHEGFEVLGATNGPDGLELIKDKNPDVVLLDLMMPGMDGWGVYQSMRSDEALREIPVIVVTTKAAPIDEVLARHIAKVDDYIPKPFGPSRLVDGIRRVLMIKELQPAV